MAVDVDNKAELRAVWVDVGLVVGNVGAVHRVGAVHDVIALARVRVAGKVWTAGTNGVVLAGMSFVAVD